MSTQERSNNNQMRSSFKSQSRSQVQYIKKEAQQEDKTPRYEELKTSQVKTNEASTNIQKEGQSTNQTNKQESVSKPSDSSSAGQSNNQEVNNNSSNNNNNNQTNQNRGERNNNNNNNPQQRKQGQRNNKHFKTTYVPKKQLQSEIVSNQEGQGQTSNNAENQTQPNQNQTNNSNENQQNLNNQQINGRQSFQGNGSYQQKNRYNYRNGSVQPKNDRYSQGTPSNAQNLNKNSQFYELKKEEKETPKDNSQYEDSPKKNQRSFQRENLRQSDKEPRTSQKKDYAQTQAMIKRQSELMFARNSRRNHSIVRTPDAHLLTSCNWDGIDNVEQSYELVQKKSINQDISSFLGQQENSISQAGQFPSLLDDSSRLSKFAPSSLRPSRKASVSSSEDNQQELTHQIHQIAQELLLKQDQQAEKEKSVHDIPIAIVQNEKQEVIMENEEFNYKEKDEEKPKAKSKNATPSSKKNNQRQNNKNQRDSINQGRRSNTTIYVRKDTAQNEQKPQQQQIVQKEQKPQQQNVQKEQQKPQQQIAQKKSIVYEEKIDVVQQQQEQVQVQQQQKQEKEKEYPDILNDIEFEMDLEINPTQSRGNQKQNQRQERDLQNAHHFEEQLVAEQQLQQEEESSSQPNKKDSSGFQDHLDNEVYPRISNLEEYVPVKFTAEQQEAFEKGEYQELQQEIDEFQKQDCHQHVEYKEECQRDVSSDVVLQQKEEEDFVQVDEDEGLVSKLSCQSPPPTENLTQQDLNKCEEENQNHQHHLSKFGQQQEQNLEEKVLEELQKKHIIQQNGEQVDNNEEPEVTESLTLNNAKEQTEQEKQTTPQGEEQEVVIKDLVVIQNVEQAANIVIEENEIQQAYNNFELQQKQNEQENVQETAQPEAQQEEEGEEVEIIVNQASTNHRENKTEKELQSHNNGQQLEDHLKQEQLNGHHIESSPSKNDNQVKEQKTIDELDKQCEYFNANSNYSSDKQNNTQTQDDTSSAKHIEMNGFLLEVQSERNFDDSNHDLNSEYPRTEAPKRRTKFLQQFSDNLKDIGRNNTCLVNSLGSNIVTTFAGFVCNKIVTSSLLKNGKLNQSSGNRTLFSSFSSYNSSLKSQENQ